jgi:hypothetical protein
MVPPSTVDVTFAVFVIEISATGIVEVGVEVDVTTTGTVDELLPMFVSVVEAFSPTVAVFRIVPLAILVLTFVRIASVAVAFGLSVPIVQVPVLEAYVPCDEVAETKFKPVGNVSVATTPVEVAGPKAVTVNV